MSEDNRGTHAFAIAALIVASVSLILTLLLAGLVLFKSSGDRAAESVLPTYLSEKALAGIAESIAEPFNAEDYEQLYSRFDPAARAQLSADTLRKQLGSLRAAIGKIDTSSFTGWQRIPAPGTLPLYQLQYALKLSGGDFASGTLSVKVMDHGDHAGIIWFFVGGTTPK
jgi:hypothetical protein